MKEKTPDKEVQVQFSCTLVMLYHSSSLGLWGIDIRTVGSGGSLLWCKGGQATLESQVLWQLHLSAQLSTVDVGSNTHA